MCIQDTIKLSRQPVCMCITAPSVRSVEMALCALRKPFNAYNVTFTTSRTSAEKKRILVIIFFHFILHSVRRRILCDLAIITRFRATAERKSGHNSMCLKFRSPLPSVHDRMMKTKMTRDDV